LSARYWARTRKFSRTRRALVLHFTLYPGDVVIRVALANRAAHDIILVPPGATDSVLYRLVRDYTKDLTRPELTLIDNHQPWGVGAPTPSHQ
jgi:hypothetical protein